MCMGSLPGSGSNDRPSTVRDVSLPNVQQSSSPSDGKTGLWEGRDVSIITADLKRKSLEIGNCTSEKVQNCIDEWKNLKNAIDKEDDRSFFEKIFNPNKNVVKAKNEIKELKKLNKNIKKLNKNLSKKDKKINTLEAIHGLSKQMEVYDNSLKTHAGSLTKLKAETNDELDPKASYLDGLSTFADYHNRNSDTNEDDYDKLDFGDPDGEEEEDLDSTRESVKETPTLSMSKSKETHAFESNNPQGIGDKQVKDSADINTADLDRKKNIWLTNISEASKILEEKLSAKRDKIKALHERANEIHKGVLDVNGCFGCKWIWIFDETSEQSRRSICGSR